MRQSYVKGKAACSQCQEQGMLDKEVPADIGKTLANVVLETRDNAANEEYRLAAF